MPETDYSEFQKEAEAAANAVGVTPYSDMRLHVEQAVKYALRSAGHASLISRVEKMEKALKGLLDYSERNTCIHEDTHRGGFLWTICDGCGRKWADDEGGFQPHVDAPEVVAARAALQTQETE